MNFLTRFAMKNTAVILLSMLLIIGGGWYSTKAMKTEALPDIAVPYLMVNIVFPGAGPGDVSREITSPVEKTLQGIDGLKNIDSYANQNVGTVVLEFNMNADLDKAQQDINFALQKVTLPETAMKPEIRRFSVNDSDIMRYSISGPDEQVTIKRFVEDKIKPALSNIDGVEDINIYGSGEKKIFIKLKADKIKEYQLSPDTVSQALKYSNLTIPAGEVTIGDSIMPIEVKKEIKGINELKKIKIITLDTGKGLKTAFTSVQDGFEQVGKALQGIGQGVVGLGQLQGALQGEIGLVNQMAEHQGKLAAAQRDLNLLLLTPNPDPQKAAALQGEVFKETEYVKGLQKGLTQMVTLIEKSTPKSNGNQQSTVSKSSNSKSMDMKAGIKIIELQNVADISYGNIKESSISKTKGKPSVTFGVARQTGGNVVEISDKVQENLKKVQLPKGYKIELLFNNADPIKMSITSMVKEGILGALFAVLVTLIFLKNIRATIVAIISIPLSIFAAIIVLNWLNYTINIMSLSGIAVAVGRVVDDSIVVIENIYRRLKDSEGSPSLVYNATKEVAGAITSSTLTTVAVFGPLAMVSGIIGKIFVPFAVTVVISLIFSLLVAVTVVPLFSRLLLLNIQPEEEKEGVIIKTYAKTLTWALNHKLVVIVTSLLLLVGSLAFVKNIGTNFLPQDEVRYYQAGISMPVGSSLEKTQKVTDALEDILKRNKAVRLYQSNTKSNGSADIFIALKDDIEGTKVISEKLRKEFNKVKGAKDISLQGLGGPGGNATLEINLNGPNNQSLKVAGKQVTDMLTHVKGLANISSNIEDIKPQIQVEINEVKAAQKGLSPIMVAGTLRGIISGDKVGSMEYGGENVDINMSYKIDTIKDLKSIQNLELLSMNGEKVLLKDVATVSQKPGPTKIQRRNLTEFVTVTALITDSNSGKVSAEVVEQLDKMKFPNGVSYSMEGNTKMMSDGFRDMGIAMLVAVFLVFVVMIGAFGGAQVPIAILASLPLALIGTLMGLLISGDQIGMPALIGGLMLIGIVVTNAIVLMDRAMHQVQLGLTIEAALVEAGKTRLRPIFMTAVATIFALMPLAVMPAEGALISRSMAVVVIGGLTTSTILTLIVVPVVYLILEKIKIKVIGNRTAANIVLSE